MTEQNPGAKKGKATPPRKQQEAARKRPLVGARTKEARKAAAAKAAADKAMADKAAADRVAARLGPASHGTSSVESVGPVGSDPRAAGSPGASLASPVMGSCGRPPRGTDRWPEGGKRSARAARASATWARGWSALLCVRAVDSCAVWTARWQTVGRSTNRRSSASASSRP